MVLAHLLDHTLGIEVVLLTQHDDHWLLPDGREDVKNVPEAPACEILEVRVVPPTLDESLDPYDAFRFHRTLPLHVLHVLLEPQVFVLRHLKGEVTSLPERVALLLSGVRGHGPDGTGADVPGHKEGVRLAR